MANDDEARLVGIILNDDGTINKFVVEQEDHKTSEIDFVDAQGLSSEEVQTLIDSATPKCLGVAESVAPWGPVDVGPNEAGGQFVPGLVVTAEVGTLPVRIQASFAAIDNGDAAALAAIQLYDDTDDVVLYEDVFSMVAYTYYSKVVTVRRDDLSPGPHVIKVRMWTSVDAAKLNVSASETWRNQLVVDECVPVSA